MSMRNASEVVELVRHLRHDYLNHFQVISGYLELGMPERAQSYISDILADAARERDLLGLQPPELGLILYQVYLQWRVQGIVLVFKPMEQIAEWVSVCLPLEIEKLISKQGWRPPTDDDLYLEILLMPVDEDNIVLIMSEPESGTSAQTQITRE